MEQGKADIRSQQASIQDIYNVEAPRTVWWKDKDRGTALKNLYTEAAFFLSFS